MAVAFVTAALATEADLLWRSESPLTSMAGTLRKHKRIVASRSCGEHA